MSSAASMASADVGLNGASFAGAAIATMTSPLEDVRAALSAARLSAQGGVKACEREAQVAQKAVQWLEGHLASTGGAPVRLPRKVAQLRAALAEAASASPASGATDEPNPTVAKLGARFVSLVLDRCGRASAAGPTDATTVLGVLELPSAADAAILSAHRLSQDIGAWFPLEELAGRVTEAETAAAAGGDAVRLAVRVFQLWYPMQRVGAGSVCGFCGWWYGACPCRCSNGSARWRCGWSTCCA